MWWLWLCGPMDGVVYSWSLPNLNPDIPAYPHVQYSLKVVKYQLFKSPVNGRKPQGKPAVLIPASDKYRVYAHNIVYPGTVYLSTVL